MEAPEFDAAAWPLVPAAAPRRAERQPRIAVAASAPYLVDEAGRDWTPIGQNDALPWPDLRGLLGRRDPAAAGRYLDRLAASGATVLRLMLEYCHHDDCFLERPAGSFTPLVVQALDDLVAGCRARGLRLLLTPFDTFFTWINWDRHPYNRANGGPCAGRDELLTCPATRDLIKRRLAFATERWGGDGTVFAWDLWNEMHPAQGRDRRDFAEAFLSDVAPWLRDLETRMHGRPHLRTASVFGPELGWRPWLKAPVFRHPALDLATSHLYEEGAIDDPADTVAAAVAVGRLVREALAEIADGRPFFDSEHGPIHRYKDKRVTLPAAFDDEYFRHMQWAHLAAGGAGGGMRWPNRTPHRLTTGMRRAQRAMADFMPLVEWQRFRRRPVPADAVEPGAPRVHLAGCADEAQAVLHLIRGDTVGPGGTLRRGAPPVAPVVRLAGMAPGAYRCVTWDARAGRARADRRLVHGGGDLSLRLGPLSTDMAVALRRVAAAV